MKSITDDIDLKILTILSDNADISYAAVGELVFVSAGTVHARVKKMEQAGIIKKKKIEIDYSKLGYDITAFLGIFLDKSDSYDSVLENLKKISEIVNIDYTTGNYSMFIKIRCKDTQHLRKVLHDKIQKVSGIARTETIISLSEDVKRPIRLSQ